MFCSNCGAKLDDNAKFCSGCGTAVGGAAVPQTPEPEAEYEIDRRKVGLYDDDGSGIGTGILTNKRFILKQVGFMGITISIANLLTEGKTVLEIPYSEIEDVSIDKIGIFRNKCVLITTKSGYKGKIICQTGSSSEFVEKWCGIIKEQMSKL